MGRIEKTVFISYRRTNAPWALAIFQHLKQRDYDVFFDFDGIASGDFESVILENIYARAHFILVLTPSALERCSESGDWLRREIETAMQAKRNVIPLMLEGFKFSTPAIASQLTGSLEPLRHYNAVNVPIDYFAEAMDRLCDKFLNVALDAVSHPASARAQQAARVQQAAATAASEVQEGELSAQMYFEQALAEDDPDEAIRLYSEAIRLDPNYAMAYSGRGAVRDNEGDAEGARADYEEAIRLDPDCAEAYGLRALARQDNGDPEGALADYDEVIRIQPNDPTGYIDRANARKSKGDLDGAIADYSQAIRLDPDDGFAYAQRGWARRDKDDLEGAETDYSEAIRHYYYDVYFDRADVRREKGDLQGALEDCDEGILFKDDDPDFYLTRSEIRKELGDLEGAEEDLKTYNDLRNADDAAVDE